MGKMQLDLLLLLLPYNALHAMAVLWLILLATFNLFGVFHLFLQFTYNFSKSLRLLNYFVSVSAFLSTHLLLLIDSDRFKYRYIHIYMHIYNSLHIHTYIHIYIFLFLNSCTYIKIYIYISVTYIQYSYKKLIQC